MAEVQVTLVADSQQFITDANQTIKGIAQTPALVSLDVDTQPFLDGVKKAINEAQKLASNMRIPLPPAPTPYGPAPYGPQGGAQNGRQGMPPGSQSSALNSSPQVANLLQSIRDVTKNQTEEMKRAFLNLQASYDKQLDKLDALSGTGGGRGGGRGPGNTGGGLLDKLLRLGNMGLSGGGNNPIASLLRGIGGGQLMGLLSLGGIAGLVGKAIGGQFTDAANNQGKAVDYLKREYNIYGSMLDRGATLYGDASGQDFTRTASVATKYGMTLDDTLRAQETLIEKTGRITNERAHWGDVQNVSATALATGADQTSLAALTGKAQRAGVQNAGDSYMTDMVTAYQEVTGVHGDEAVAVLEKILDEQMRTNAIVDRQSVENQINGMMRIQAATGMTGERAAEAYNSVKDALTGQDDSLLVAAGLGSTFQGMAGKHELLRMQAEDPEAFMQLVTNNLRNMFNMNDEQIVEFLLGRGVNIRDADAYVAGTYVKEPEIPDFTNQDAVAQVADERQEDVYSNYVDSRSQAAFGAKIAEETADTMKGYEAMTWKNSDLSDRDQQLVDKAINGQTRELKQQRQYNKWLGWGETGLNLAGRAISEALGGVDENGNVMDKTEDSSPSAADNSDVNGGSLGTNRSRSRLNASRMTTSSDTYVATTAYEPEEPVSDPAAAFAAASGNASHEEVQQMFKERGTHITYADFEAHAGNAQYPAGGMNADSSYVAEPAAQAAMANEPVQEIIADQKELAERGEAQTELAIKADKDVNSALLENTQALLANTRALTGGSADQSDLEFKKQAQNAADGDLNGNNVQFDSKSMPDVLTGQQINFGMSGGYGVTANGTTVGPDGNVVEAGTQVVSNNPEVGTVSVSADNKTTTQTLPDGTKTTITNSAPGTDENRQTQIKENTDGTITAGGSLSGPGSNKSNTAADELVGPMKMMPYADYDKLSDTEKEKYLRSLGLIEVREGAYDLCERAKQYNNNYFEWKKTSKQTVSNHDGKQTVTNQKTPHAIGNDYVPYDGYEAVLHQGEMVLAKDDAETLRQGKMPRLGYDGDTYAETPLTSLVHAAQWMSNPDEMNRPSLTTLAQAVAKILDKDGGADGASSEEIFTQGGPLTQLAWAARFAKERLGDGADLATLAALAGVPRDEQEQSGEPEVFAQGVLTSFVDAVKALNDPDAENPLTGVVQAYAHLKNKDDDTEAGAVGPLTTLVNAAKWMKDPLAERPELLTLVQAASQLKQAEPETDADSYADNPLTALVHASEANASDLTTLAQSAAQLKGEPEGDKSPASGGPLTDLVQAARAMKTPGAQRPDLTSLVQSAAQLKSKPDGAVSSSGGPLTELVQAKKASGAQNPDLTSLVQSASELKDRSAEVPEESLAGGPLTTLVQAAGDPKRQSASDTLTELAKAASELYGKDQKPSGGPLTDLTQAAARMKNGGTDRLSLTALADAAANLQDVPKTDAAEPITAEPAAPGGSLTDMVQAAQTMKNPDAEKPSLTDLASMAAEMKHAPGDAETPLDEADGKNPLTALTRAAKWQSDPQSTELPSLTTLANAASELKNGEISDSRELSSALAAESGPNVEELLYAGSNTLSFASAPNGYAGGTMSFEGGSIAININVTGEVRGMDPALQQQMVEQVRSQIAASDLQGRMMTGFTRRQNW